MGKLLYKNPFRKSSGRGNEEAGILGVIVEQPAAHSTSHPHARDVFVYTLNCTFGFVVFCTPPRAHGNK